MGRYPKGASPFGVQDLVGAVWQFTSEFQDNHTRAVILRGGSNYGPWRGAECRNAQTDACAKVHVPGSTDPATGCWLPHPEGGSEWYFPPAFELDSYNKYFLFGPSYERAGTVGFRCVADAA